MAGWRSAPWIPSPVIGLGQGFASWVGPHTPMIGRIVAANMRAAGVYSDAALRAYFDQVALHLANALRIFRLKGRPGAVDRLARDQINLDESIRSIKDLVMQGRGVLLAPAHTVNFVLTLARVNQEVPVRVFLRWSRDAGKLRLKREWCAAAGLGVILEPASSLSATSRAAICVEALRGGAVLAIAPDIAQKVGRGASVEVFGRRAWMPNGAAGIAQLAESPMIPLFGRLEDDRQLLYAAPPITVPRLRREAGGRKAALQQAMQNWATAFEAFVRHCPATWFLWGDNRWTRVFRNDPKYTGPCEAPATNKSQSPPLDPLIPQSLNPSLAQPGGALDTTR